MAEKVFHKGYRVPQGLRPTATDEEKRRYLALVDVMLNKIAIRNAMKPIYTEIVATWKKNEAEIDELAERMANLEDGQQEMNV